MAQINVTEIDAAFIKIDAEPSILQELREYFTFRVPGAEFHPSVRNHYAKPVDIIPTVPYPIITPVKHVCFRRQHPK